ncbi:rod shape-determining protein RodA [Aquirufa regiilacus]|uniref:Cell wall polymerase n=1 Tax=Aquirufa regiilacus TaxID=3024868 RepID=A0ABU3TU24_9BACT|nr:MULTISPECIES: rod shape-determining protein RodA [unclassified Aquirufa]MDT8887648.1 rod shape-determining protein RodA [Aquirufa sp. LEPPI-3A]MDU0809340.1 rod shape-determining protein RodA [Aquirufa sp. LEOWEIH-7C]
MASRLDWWSVGLYALFVLMGWMSIYSAVYNPEAPLGLFDAAFYTSNAGKQLIWIGTSFVLIMFIFALDFRFFESFAPMIYGLFIFLLILVPFLGVTINGSHSWFKIGTVTIQPAEFAKTATALLLAKYLNDPQVSLTRFRNQWKAALIMFVPILLIVGSNETGSALVFVSFIILLYREGLPGEYPGLLLGGIFLFVSALILKPLTIFILLVILAGMLVLLMPIYLQRMYQTYVKIALGISVVMSLAMLVEWVVNNVLKEHQRNRIKVLLDPDFDPRGLGYQVTQSKIAIGSGGFWGKGYLGGTQTKFDFVPEQSTDFIFCTIGEEFGFIGVAGIIILFMVFLWRLMYLADLQRSRFARAYGFGVVGILFFHFLVNIGMTIGLMPIMGIPLPFFSYGGSSLWSFTILLFIFLKLDSHRSDMLSR